MPDYTGSLDTAARASYVGSLISQRLDRIEVRGLARPVVSEKNSDSRGKGESDRSALFHQDVKKVPDRE